MGFEMVERGPGVGVEAARPSSRRRGLVIEDPDTDLIRRWKEGEDGAFATFVYRVAANAALNRRRTLGRSRARIEKLAVRQAAGDDLPYSPRDPEDATAGIELTSHVRAALQKLSPALRMPVVLYDIEGLAYAEIAEVLSIAEGTVKSRIHRARQALRVELKSLLGKSDEESSL
jgi:RNA polymerase sigma factor (sigma-70 family)